eukprot:8021862-Pyramimonas_sp.AAC.1
MQRKQTSRDSRRVTDVINPKGPSKGLFWLRFPHNTHLLSSREARREVAKRKREEDETRLLLARRSLRAR